MKTVYDFLVSPVDDNRYDNVKKVGDKNLILNTEIYNHQHVNREAVVNSIPAAYNTPIKVGDKVLVHHNVFRMFHNMKGEEVNSRSYYKENQYFLSLDQMYMYNNGVEWRALNGYCFVKPLINKDILDQEKEIPLMGIVKYSDGTVKQGELVGFKPDSEFEFVVNNERLYRVLSKFITIKYEYQGNEEEYNPSWA